MSTAIIYISKRGATEKNVMLLKEKLTDDTLYLCNLKSDSCNPENFDNVIIGGPIYAGQLSGKIKKFCKKHAAVLQHKKLGLFITCMDETDKVKEFLSNNYPEGLLNVACATGVFGGEFNFDRMNFLERAIIKKISGSTENISKINEKAIDDFVAAFNN